MKKFLLFTVLVMVLSGCGPTTKEVMNSYMGKTKKDVILAWGPPTRVTEDGDGGEILIYEKWVNYGSSTYGNVNNSGDYNQRSSQYTKHFVREFYINKEGRVYYWRFKN